MRLLLVEDDNSLAQAVAAVLGEQHYVVDIAADGQDGWDLAEVCSYDLILLDVMLPKLDGISLCRQLRQEGYQMPILLLTAKDTRTDKVMGLDAGADDYLVKPFDFQELAARIRALLRRGNSSLPPVLEWGNLHLDPSSCEVTYASQALHLTPKEFSVLELFLRNNQRVFSRSAIIDHLWGADEDPPEENTIKSHIKSLRQKLKAAGANYDLIETVYGIGYRLKPLPQEQSCQPTEKEPNSEQQQAMWAALAKAREEFKAKVGSRIAVLEQATNALREGTVDVQLRQKAEQEAHKLAGSLGSFGFAQGSLLAQEIEHLLQSSINHSLLSPRLCKLVMKLQQELEQPAEPISVESMESSQCHNMILLVSSDRQVVEQLVNEATTQGIQVNIATDNAAARSAIANVETRHSKSLQPDVVLLDLCCYDDVKESFKLVAELSNRTPPIPVMVFTDQSNFTERVEVARAGGRGFLDKSMLPNQMLELVTQVLQRHSASSSRVMVVDDDPHVLTIVQKLLEPWGFRLTTLEDPRRFWEILTEVSPDLLILDVEMPHINGIELCQVVRNDPYWKRLPVLFLTVHVEADTVERMFAAGADDCVSKPIVESQLVTRIFNRLQRTQLLRK
ncbi:response regulator [Iningainema tapete]|uniref:Response regulator n=1 Tax=Iningainema tapete BLCC-T55 TaxID=2748662 RepID=A0A8J6XLS8_9CYAN|nr:response regulator [Iningainema tapete]MBD2774004.1 response regulator [Iningainema tapete BLCC-T55]